MKEGFLGLEDERAYVLRELEVFNWGPFAGKHRAEFDERGTAIIGSTGSGKNHSRRCPNDTLGREPALQPRLHRRPR